MALKRKKKRKKTQPTWFGNFIYALQQMRMGHSVTRKSWPKGRGLVPHGTGAKQYIEIVKKSDADVLGSKWNPSQEDILADDWKLWS